MAIAAFLGLPEIFPGNSRLYQAIADGDLERVSELLADGADPNSRASGLSGLGGGFESDLSGQYSPLLFAIYRNEAEIALALVQAGADSEERNPAGNTAIMAAAEQAMTGVVRALIAAGANLQATNPYNGDTVLYRSAGFGVPGEPSPKWFQDPEIEVLLKAAGAR